MPRFLVGDELGNIKSLSYDQGDNAQLVLKTIKSPQAPNAVQALASSSTAVATAHADGSIFAYSLNDDESVSIISQWKDNKLASQRFIGLEIQSGIYTCTSNGFLRRFPFEVAVSPQTVTLPTRLNDWKLSRDCSYFAYGGDEVELSVWDTAKAFDTPLSSKDMSGSKAASKKRKRNNALFDGEIWRAKNVSNDNLGLRQPVRISTLSYVTPSSSPNNLLITGTEFGNVRRYDTRISGCKPTSDWSGFTQGSGIKAINCGLREHEAFVSDVVNGLYALDLRNGKVIYKYKGIAGAITSVALSPTFLASASRDRLCRIHSTVTPPPGTKNTNSGGAKGQVLEKIYMTSTPTVIVWDGQYEQSIQQPTEEEEEEEIWEGMPNVHEKDESSTRTKKKQKL